VETFPSKFYTQIASDKYFLPPSHLFTQDAKNTVDVDLVMLEEIKVKCRAQTEQIMAWKKAYSMQVIEFDFFSLSPSTTFNAHCICSCDIK
jgi:hypothetical protein